MPRLIPPDPQFVNSAERDVWTALRESLSDNDVLMANVRFTDRAGDREGDLIVGVEGAGIIVVEVKGGSVSHDGVHWHQHGAVSKRIDPVEQARTVKYALRDYLNDDQRWGRRRTRFRHAVAFPYSKVASDFALPSCPRWMVLDKDDLDGAAASNVREMLRKSEDPNPAPTLDELDAMVEILGGRMRPQRDVLALSAERKATTDLLTERQAVILPALRMLNRVEIRGGAGSGKTWLAVEQVRRLAAEGKRVALMCYSRGLAEYLTRWVSTLKPREQPAYVGTFHGLGIRWGAPVGSDDDSQFWEEDLPRTMTELARTRPAAERFDAIVIDEAQDFAEAWWPAVLSALVDEDQGAIYAFFDEGQRVFARGGRPPLPLVPIVLEENIRNTKPIAQTFGSLAPMQMRYRGGDGDPVRFISCSDDEAISTADDAVDQLLEEGWLPEHVALLTTGTRHPEQRERQARGQDAYWASFWDKEQVFYGHVLGFKGLERPAVVLAVNGFGTSAAGGDGSVRDGRAREKLYVGLSRARDLLVVCGDPATLREVGGEAVYQRLITGESGTGT